MKKITSGLLVKWAIGPVATIYLTLMGIACLFAQAEHSGLIDQYPVFLSAVLVVLLAAAAGFYAKLRRHMMLHGQFEERSGSALALQRTAVLSMLASIQVVCVLMGIALMRKGQSVAGIIFMAAGTAILLPLVMVAMRHYRVVKKQTNSHANISLANLIAFSMLLALVMVCLIVGFFLLQRGSNLAAALFLTVGLALAALNTAVAIREIRRYEAPFGPERRIFRIAMTIFWLSVMVVTSFIAGAALLFGLQLTLYALGSFLIGGLLLWELLRQCKNAELRFSAAQSN